MSFVELFLLAAALSMDAFAVSIALGLTFVVPVLAKSAVVGLYFGFFQAAMPLIGYFGAKVFAEKIIALDHWVAFGLLAFLGSRMLVGSFAKDDGGEAQSGGTCLAEPQSENGEEESALADNGEASLSPAKMVPFAIATSIDALAAGVSLAFLKVKIIMAVSLIGVSTFSFSILGVVIGNSFGSKLKSKAEMAGGVILILIGAKILREHLGFWVQ
ncbi:MAG: manganese efflux pump MntP family protein [Eubacteriaceae bacterium]|nr:manganese efflux pump MntP family protein [Eubacteriaceae bacterium]